MVFFCLAALLSPLIGLVVVLVLPNLRAEAARQKERAQEHELQIESIKAIARAPSAATATPSGSIADELVKLAALRDSGVLTDAEFATQKARLMG